MPAIFGRLRGRRALAWLKHRRWWMFYVDPIGPSDPRITEEGDLRITEEGSTRITEGF